MAVHWMALLYMLITVFIVIALSFNTVKTLNQAKYYTLDFELKQMAAHQGRGLLNLIDLEVSVCIPF